jgi:dimethylhistidine N-methyltransferase
MSDAVTSLEIADYEPETATFRRDVVEGLRKSPPAIPSKYFYDERGAELFERICELPEYYPTRTELSITQRWAGEMADALGPRCVLVEYGSGASLKTRVLLDHLKDPAAYVPIDISREQLERTAAALNEDYPALEVLPVCADYTGDYEIPEPSGDYRRDAVYFPGSTIGNFTPERARAFLVHAREVLGENAGMLVGVDLKKDPSVLEAAYNDAAGVTAAFNLNLLARANRELGADFALEGFGHRALWSEEAGRIEMHLESLRDQTVTIGEETFSLSAGTRIHTENSYKYSLGGFAELADAAGWRHEQAWCDPERLFSVHYLAG